MGLEFNFNSLISKLENMEKKVSKEITDNALIEGGKVVLEELRKEVKNNVYDTGELYDSLDLGKISGSGTNKKISIGSQSSDKAVVARNYYNEHGNSYMMGKKHNKKAFENSKKEAKETIIKTVMENLKNG